MPGKMIGALFLHQSRSRYLRGFYFVLQSIVSFNHPLTARGLQDGRTLKTLKNMRTPLTREQAQAIYQAGEEAVISVLLEMDQCIRRLEARVEELESIVLKQGARIKELEDQLAKNSRNSSKPPSTDGYHKPAPKSMREKSGCHTGGQPGHPGQTLRMAEAPDHIEIHRVKYCERCGGSLADVPVNGIEKRQVHDLPPIQLMVTEHQAEKKICSCGHINKAGFPEGVNAAVQYGPEVKARAVYLKNYQLLPYERTCELMGDCFGAPMSEGTLDNLIGECHDRLEIPVKEIKEQITQAGVAHFDETGSRVGKELWWLHSASTSTATYYDIHPKRGSTAMDAIGILPGFIGRAIHDFWKPYFGYECDHGLCNAHHLRELIFVYEEQHQLWAGMMIQLLLKIKAAVEEARSIGRLGEDQLRFYEADYQIVLKQGYVENALAYALAELKSGRQKKGKSINLLERLDHHRSEVLAFMHDFNVPFENNQAERDIRMVKVQQKISGTFRSEAGAKAFCRIRSYISTARKNAVGAMTALARVFSGSPVASSVNSS